MLNPNSPEQIIFDAAVAHMRKQKGLSSKPTIGMGKCMYRSTNDAGEVVSCAIGGLIKDEFYSPDLEGHCSIDAGVVLALQNSGYVITEEMISDGFLLYIQQELHDDLDDEFFNRDRCMLEYERIVKKTAKMANLIYTKP